MESPVAEVRTTLEAKAASFVKENRLPGAAVGIVHEDKLVWSKGIGFADVKKKRRADPKTLYRIASITKTFTATAVMQLRDEGKLALDDPLVDVPPRARRREEHVRADRRPHDPPAALARVRPAERAAGRRLLARPLRERGRQEPRARRRHLADGAAEHAVEVLEPRLPAARRARRSRVGDDVRAVHPLADPHPAEDDVDRARSASAAAARTEGDRLRAALSLGRARPGAARPRRVPGRRRALVVRRGPRALALVPVLTGAGAV